MSRKTPILLREGPLSGHIEALTRYTTAGGMLKVVGDGKQDVHADFCALICELLLNPAPDIIPILGLFDGEGEEARPAVSLSQGQREQVTRFRRELRKLVVFHNEEGHGSSPGPED